MAEVFNFKVQASPTGTASFSTIDAQFGDGYSQSAADGINNKGQSWSVRLRGLDSPGCVQTENMLAVEAFLDARGGWQSFEWTTRAAILVCSCAKITASRKMASCSHLTPILLRCFANANQ